MEFADYREYSPGDPADLIDWAVYARSDKYVIRRYEEETSIRGYVLLDCSESMGFKGEAPSSKGEYARSLAAGMMYVLVNQHDSAGLVVFNEKIVTLLPPAHSLPTLHPHLKALEDIRDDGRSDIGSAMHDAAEIISPKSFVIVISDLLEPPEKILNGINHLHFLGHEIMLMHVLDPCELMLKMPGINELQELETGKRMLVNADEIRDAYSASVEHYIQTIRAGCASLSVDYSLNNTSVPAVEAIHKRTLRA